MRKLHSFLLVTFAILSFALMPNKEAKASHAAGGEIIYEWISDSTYRIFFKFYRDCTGISEPGSASVCITDSCNSYQTTITMNKWSGALPGGGVNGDPVSAGCSAYPNSCQTTSTSLPGYREWWYSAIVQLPSRCIKWRFSTSVNARNGSLNIGGGNLYVETTFNNQQFQGNSSPYFSIKPIPYVCVNQPYTYNNGAIDPDGDSLVTDIIRPMDAGSECGPGSSIAFTTLTPALNTTTNPFQTNNTFVINAATGQMGFTASTIGAHTLTTRVREFRNGTLIGYIMRDIQVQVLNCSTSAPASNINLASLVGGGSGVGGRIEGCIGQPLSFNWASVSNDTGAVLTATDNHMFSIPAATVTYSNIYTDSVVGSFSWTPTASDAGILKNLIVTIKDSTCRPPGIMLYFPFTIPIYIWPKVTTVNDTNICPKETAFLTAYGGGDYVWSVLPGGSPITSLNCTNCTSPIASPGMSTTYVVTSTINSFCNNNKDTVTVGVLPGLVFTKHPDTLTCPGNPIKLNLYLPTTPGVTYKTKWSPATYLDNDTLNVPTTNPKAPITYTVVMSSSINRCKAFDTLVVDVLSGFNLQNGDTAVCEGQQFKVNISGDSRYTYSWSTTGLPGVFSNPNVIDPTITPAPLGKSTYTLTAKYPSCPIDSSAEFDITVEPVPQVKVDNDASMCENDTMQLHGIVIPSTFTFALNWTPGASLNNTTIASPIFKAQQTTELILTATSPLAKCTASDTVKLTVFPADFVKVEGDTAICPGSKTNLSVTGGSIKSFRWYPDYRISDPTSANPTVNPVTSQVYTVYAVDTNACFDTASVKVIVRPGGTLFMPDTVKLYPGESYQMDPMGNCTYFSWFPSVGLSRSDISNPIVKTDVNTKYTVTGMTESGCVVTDEVNVLVMDESLIEVPNAFSPGNGANGKFKVLRRGDATLKSFTIFNRWGAKVFETSDINAGWDGTFNGEAQPMGVYIYTIDAVSVTGKRITKQGNVTLVR